MKKFNIISSFAALALIGACLAVPARAQTLGEAVMVKQNPSKPVWLKAEVLHLDLNFITVREEANGRMLRTFTYAPHAQEQVEKLLAKGGYQYGDKVQIRYETGQTVALAIKGRASKPPRPQPTAPLRPQPESTLH